MDERGQFLNQTHLVPFDKCLRKYEGISKDRLAIGREENEMSIVDKFTRLHDYPGFFLGLFQLACGTLELACGS